MPIQFSCSSCGKKLSVPDGAAGRQARCPNCSNVIRVPDPAAEAPQGDEYQLSPPETGSPADIPQQPSQPASSGNTGSMGSTFPDVSAPAKPNPYSENPYASPTAGYDPNFGKTATGGTPGHNIIQFEDVFGYAWKLYNENLGMVLGAVLVTGVINIVSGQVLQIAVSILSMESEAAGLILAIFGQIALGIFNTFIHIGQTKILLDVARGRQANFGDLFCGGRYLLWAVLGWIAYIIMIYVGLLAVIVGAIFVALFFGQFLYLIVDKDMNLGDAFLHSIQLSNGNKMTLFVIYLVGTLIILGSMIACLLPVIYFGPFVALVYVVAYVKMTGGELAKVQV